MTRPGLRLHRTVPAGARLPPTAEKPVGRDDVRLMEELTPLTQYPGRVQVFKQVLAPREPALVTHDGYEWLYVLAGELRLILGQRDCTLHPGEVAEFDTREPHWFGPANNGVVEILHLFGPRGDQAVVRAKPSVSDPDRANATTPPSTTS